MPTIDYLFEHAGLTIEDVADQAGLPLSRVEAIASGRWTPSPNERQRIAQVFGVKVNEIGWGHSVDPRNIRYRRFGMPDADGGT